MTTVFPVSDPAMNLATSDDMLVILCHQHLLDIKNRLQARRAFRPTKEEARAQLQIVEKLFELAAGAAVTRNMRKSSIRPIIQVVDDLTFMLNPPCPDTNHIGPV